MLVPRAIISFFCCSQSLCRLWPCGHRLCGYRGYTLLWKLSNEKLCSRALYGQTRCANSWRKDLTLTSTSLVQTMARVWWVFFRMPPKKAPGPVRGTATPARGAAKPSEPNRGRGHVHGAGVVSARGGSKARGGGQATRGRGTVVTAPRGRGVASAGRGVASTRGAKTARGGASAKTTPTKTAASGKGEVPKKPAWTKEDEAARKIQCMVRGRLARKKKEELVNAKRNYEEEIDRIQKEVIMSHTKKLQSSWVL